MQRETKTGSENCGEEGIVSIDDKNYQALLDLAGLTQYTADGGWGLQPRVLLELEEQHYDDIQRQLQKVTEEWSDSSTLFDYIGGNYDIAGTISLIHLYNLKTGDNRFNGLASTLYEYLHGKNKYHVDFTDVKDIHHPCGKWWARCDLAETLVNGADESLAFDLARPDAWRISEVQLVGQAEYVLAYILHNKK
jgi:hypothetical protein